MKPMQKKISTLIALSLLSISTANAELIIDDGSSKTVIGGKSAIVESQTITNNNISSQSNLKMKPAPYKSKNVTEHGTRIITQPLSGWSDGLELSIVLEQIVPKEHVWTLTPENVDLTKKVSYKADGEAWISVFSRVVDQNNLKADVDWNSKKIKLAGTDKSIKSTTAKTTPIKNNQSNIALKPALSFGSEKIMKPFDAKPVVAKRTWVISDKKTLRGNIEDWAKAEGWTVSWTSAPDYPIISGFTLTGDFTANDGPVHTLIKGFEEAKQPLIVKMYKGNKVIKVSSRVYEQGTVINSSIENQFNSLK